VPWKHARVDRIPTPKLDWQLCYDTAECATVALPLDYDQPQGAQIEVALLRVKARDQVHKIGSLFINPGGPGGSGVQIALALANVANPRILDRFDLIGMDPAEPTRALKSGASHPRNSRPPL